MQHRARHAARMAMLRDVRDETRDGRCVEGFEGGERRSSAAGLTYENVLPKRRGVLTMTSLGHVFHPFLAMIRGRCDPQSAR